MEVKQSKRIQTSILSGTEKKVLRWLALRQPSWMTSDMMTAIGVLGAIIIGAGYALTNYGIGFLWLSTLGYVINWYGDSLDGTLARVRNRQRPIYGYYLDHTVDGINEVFMFIGAGLSPFFDLRVTMLALVFYLLLTVNVSMNAHLRSEFNLTYAGMGPTEFRIVMMILNTVMFCFGERMYDSIVPNALVIVITAVLGIIYLVTVFSDLRKYSKLDPMPKD